MFLIARGPRQLASWDGADGETQAYEANSSGYITFSQKAWRHEYDARIKSGPVHLHRQMDTKGFVFARRKALSARAVAPTAG